MKFHVRTRGRNVVTAHRVDGKLVLRELSIKDAFELANQIAEAAALAGMQPLEPGDVVREVTGGNGCSSIH